MPRYEVHASPEIAIKLGAYPARRVRKDLSFPCYEVPNSCVIIHTSIGPLIWMLVSQNKQDESVKKNG